MISLEQFTCVCKEIFFFKEPKKEHFFNYDYLYDYLVEDFNALIDYIAGYDIKLNQQTFIHSSYYSGFFIEEFCALKHGGKFGNLLDQLINNINHCFPEFGMIMTDVLSTTLNIFLRKKPNVAYSVFLLINRYFVKIMAKKINKPIAFNIRKCYERSSVTDYMILHITRGDSTESFRMATIIDHWDMPNPHMFSAKIVRRAVKKIISDPTPGEKSSFNLFTQFLVSVYGNELILRGYEFFNMPYVFEFYEEEFMKTITYTNNLKHQYSHSSLWRKINKIFNKEKHDFIIKECVTKGGINYCRLVFPKGLNPILTDDLMTLANLKKWIICLFARELGKNFSLNDYYYIKPNGLIVFCPLKN